MVERSLIAGANAWFRAAESQRSQGDRILFDPWAELLAERDLRVQAIRFGRFGIPPLRRTIDELQAAHCVRHRCIDELMLRALDDGFEQVVIIGAGYDMRASRFASRLEGVRIVEIDHPATQARKIERLARRRDVNERVVRVSIDLASEPLSHALEKAGVERTRSTCFLAEGLIHYLPMHRLESLLASTETIRARRRFVASFIRSEMYFRADTLFIQLVKAVEEIPRLHFAIEDLRELLAHHGFAGLQTWAIEDQVRVFAKMASHRRVGLSQDVLSAESNR